MTAAPTEILVHVVRVFTTEEGDLGNALGIVDSSDASRGHEQEIATRLGFSETVFVEPREVEPRESGAERARLRIFTPARELPFAGHPSVGTAWWLREQGTPVAALDVPAGEVAVRYDGDVAWITGRAAWAPEFAWQKLDTEDEVAALDQATFTEGHHYAYAWTDEAAGSLRSRMFAPDMGVAEDEATGAAAVRLTGVLGRDLDITQGQGSRIRTRRLEGDLIEVGGRVVRDADVSVHIG